MIVDVYSWEDGDFNTHEALFIDGEEKLHVGPLCDCPEDAIIGRDLVSAADVARFMELAYNEAKDPYCRKFELNFIEGTPDGF